ncbi:MAG: ArsC/Spx/MgsR family protein [Elainellaceae cyanobacterium]
MVTVVFYEKPGCINNAKQKALLWAAGHQVESRHLLREVWTPETLRPFLPDRPVAEWFNKTAPQVKSGEVQPDQLDAVTAIALLVQHPILIRRPLMRVGDRCEMGFDQQLVDRWIGLRPVPIGAASIHDRLMTQDLETCPRLSNHVTAAL